MIVEIRSYNLKPGTRARFQRVVDEQALPLLRKWKMDVVRASPTLHEEESFVLIRAFASLAARQAEEDAFYGSDEWKSGPRAEVLSLIENYSSVVLELSNEAVAALRA